MSHRSEMILKFNMADKLMRKKEDRYTRRPLKTRTKLEQVIATHETPKTAITQQKLRNIH